MGDSGGEHVRLNVEHHEDVTCRNCHEYGGDDLIAPCQCSGSIKYVHRKCLNDWRAYSPNPDSFTHCDVCGFAYQFTQRDDLKSGRMMKFALVVTRDIIGAMLVIQAIVVALGGIAYAIDKKSEGSLASFFPAAWSRLAVYYIWGLFFFSVLVAVYGAIYLLFKCMMSTESSRSVSYDTYPYYYGPYYYWFYYPNGYSCFPMCYCGDCSGGGCLCCGNCHSNVNCGGNCPDGNNNGGGMTILGLIVLAVAIIVGFVVMVVVATIILRRHAKILKKKQDACEMEILDLDNVLTIQS